MVNFKKIKAAALSGMLAATTLAGSVTAAAPSLNVAAANDNYAKLLQYSLYFYDANMCGNIGSKCAIDWRGNCHTSDGVPGGYHDAGDHAMFGLPQGFTASMLEWSYYEFKDAYDATGQTAHFKVVMDHFIDFFKASTKLSGDNVTSLLYQKGDGNEDHAYWGPPEKQGGNRQMMWTSNGAGDVAADYAAALALHYINFGDTESLKYAEALYSYATRNPGTVDHSTFYQNGSSQDEIGNAAGWLYMATKKENYKNDCASKQAQYLGWVDGWENRDLGSACVYAEITGDWSKVNGWIGQKATGSNYMFLDKWGSARLNCSMQFTALVATKHSNADYGSWCKGQMDYILGSNPKNVCFVTGFAPNSAKRAHHRAASVNYEGNYEHTLIGALVGGPEDAGGSYEDVISNYVCNEVAIDYNAGLVGSAAGLYSMYKSGKTDSSIEGVSKIYSGGDTPTPTQPQDTTQPQQTTQSTQGGDKTTETTKTTSAPSGGDTVLLPADMKVGQEEGDDGATNNYAEFSPKGAKSATLYLTVKSNDTEVSGGFGTWTGKWEQVDFSGVKVGSDKTVAIDYDIPSNVGSTVKAMVWWPHGDDVVIDKVVLHGSSSGNTTKSTTKTTEKTTERTTASTQPQQTQPTQGNKTKAGDANKDGRITMADAAAILQYLGNSDRYPLDDTGRANADCDGQSGVTTNDALAIQQVVAGVMRESDLK